MKTLKRLAISIILIALIGFATSMFSDVVDPVIKTELSTSAVNGGYTEFSAQTAYHKASREIPYMGIVSGILLFWSFFPLLYPTKQQSS